MKKLPKLVTIMLYIVGITFILSLIIIRYFSTKLEPALKYYLSTEVKRVLSLVINDTISNTTNYIDINKIIIDSKNSNAIDVNTKYVNQVLANINRDIEENLRLIEDGKINNLKKYFSSLSDIDYEELKGGVIYYISSGNISGNVLTNNIGPKIPIKFAMAGHVTSKIDSKIREYGINNVLLEINVNVSVNMSVNIPFVTKEVKVETSMPLIIRVVEGEIPDYYLTNSKADSR